MDPYEIITRKKVGEQLTADEIDYMISGYTEGSIPDYQMSAFLMAVWFRELSKEERAFFTRSMIESGIQFSFPESLTPTVDKHSTGGVGDGVSLSLVPLVASFGVRIPMMSGRGLGHTGGTLDKLESIPGFEVEHDEENVRRALEQVGAIILGQSEEIAPADKKIYSLRDATATVNSIDLIASSIMSKKVAEGTDSLVLDVKTGSGAFMTEYDDSLELARAMIEIGAELGVDVRAYITNMDQPLGNAVGNALEMKQHIQLLRGNGPDDLTRLVSYLGATMMEMSGADYSFNLALDQLKRRIQSGDSIEKLQMMIEWQSGDTSVLDDFTQFPEASQTEEIKSTTGGFVSAIDAYEVGMAAHALGAGRETMESEIDLSAGVILRKKIGDQVEEGETVAELYYNEDVDESLAKSRLRDAFEYDSNPPTSDPLIYSRIHEDGREEILDITRP